MSFGFRWRHEHVDAVSDHLARLVAEHLLGSFVEQLDNPPVSDTGVGVAVEKQKKLFEPFVQADGSMTRKFGGTGLGLSISNKLMEFMGGSIGFFSAGEGQGSTVTVTIPTQL